MTEDHPDDAGSDIDDLPADEQTGTGADDVAATPAPAGVAARPRSRRRWPSVAIVAAVVAVAAVVVAVVRQPPAEPEGTVVVFGDSLSVEAREAFAAELAATSGARVTNEAVPGMSPCDAVPAMEAAASAPEPPDVVVIQFVGNNESGCSRGPDGQRLTGQALADRVEADVRAAVEMFAAAGSRVVLVGGPDAPGLPGEASLLIADAFEEIVNEWAGRDLGRVRYADAAATVTGPDHRYVPRLPCRPDERAECQDGEVQVRATDEVHFCPTNDFDDALRCTVPSPGAVRFGTEMARVARLALDPGY
ncbi:MAG TPA: SGNH hydrolase domain-containing protein [Acidimicrobiales bacterium]|nr:SGNH hydrolase domain-containing protein [Acidimicrobiales bacterium]